MYNGKEDVRMSSLQLGMGNSLSAIILLSLVLTACGNGSLNGNGSTPAATPPPVNPVAPSVTVSASPASIAIGATSVVTWSSTNSTSCASSGGGGTGTTGSFTTPALTTTTSYTVTCAGLGGTASQSTTVTVATPSACSTTGATGAITLSNVPSRLTGVAPLSVFFDASGTTTASATIRPFHDLGYRWNFGDPAGGATWARGARAGISSRNTDTGPLAAHVYGTPGVYNVSLSVTDGTNTVSNSCVQITVQNPDTVFSRADTVCVSTGTDFTGCPAGAITHTTSSFNTAMGYIGSSVHRLLFKAGDVWTGATDATISTAGPGLVGSFGTGAEPVFVAGALAGRLLLVQANDWRIVGLDFDGNMTNPNSGGVQLSSDAYTTVQNVHIHKLSWGISGGGSSYAVVQEVVIDNIDPASSNAAAVYWTPATTSALLGNYINPTGYGDHVIRMGGATKFIIAHNTLGDPGSGNGEVIKLHQVNSTPGLWDGHYTEQVIIADNHVLPITTAWQIVVAPQNDAYPEHLRDIIVERNWMESRSGTANAQISMTTVDLDGLHPSTVRNNILDMSTSNTGITGIVVQTYTSIPNVNNVRVYNNTCYSSVAANFRCVQISGATNTLVYNNLASAPSAASRTMLIDGGTGTLQAANLLNNTPSAIFVSGTPSLPSDYALKSGANPAVDTGTAVPVFDDFLLNIRPNGSAWDIGAYER
jgi:hypothetical protein